MEPDLVERLRAWHRPGETVTGDVQLYLDAADEIERLRADNNRLRAMLVRELTSEELRMVDRHCEWVHFKPAFNAVMKHRNQQP